MNNDSRINLFVDAHVFDQLPQGTLTFIREIYLQIAGRPGIRLFLGAHDTDRLAGVFPPGESVVLVKYASTSGLSRLLFEVPAIIRKYDIDYAHFQYMTPLWKNCKQIVTVHDVIFNDFPDEFSRWYRMRKRLLYGLAAWRSDILTTVSDFSGASIRKFLHTGSRPIHVIHNGVNDRFFQPFDRARSKEFIRHKYGFDKFILYVSRIEPRKNHLSLLKAWLELRLFEKGYHLVFLGHGTLPVPELEQLLAQLPEEAAGRVFRSSSVGDDHLLEMYRAASLFVYPSKGEGFGIPPLEAAALKTPVLCSNTSAMRDFSFFGRYHIDPYNYEELKEKIDDILRHPPEEQWLEKVSAIIKEEYSWRSSADKLYRLLV
jgi:glycosyltransferase involved in cell wall biosynthesis